jgi:hypothetical protein
MTCAAAIRQVTESLKALGLPSPELLFSHLTMHDDAKDREQY